MYMCRHDLRDLRCEICCSYVRYMYTHNITSSSPSSILIPSLPNPLPLLSLPSLSSPLSPSLISDEDTDIKAIVKSWLKRHSSSSSSLAGWIEDYYHPALDWILKNGDTIMDTTVVGLVVTGLSHLMGAGSKAEFTCGLVRGLGSNLTLESRTKFAKEVSLWQ